MTHDGPALAQADGRPTEPPQSRSPEAAASPATFLLALVDFKDQPKTSKTVIDSGGRAKTTGQYLFQRLCPFGKNSAKL